MIAVMVGQLVEMGERSVILLTAGGVGYELYLPSSSLARMPAKGGEVRLCTQQVVREDALELYGFETMEERRVFQVLTSIPNLGPRKALAILSRFRPDELRQVVMEGDLTAITSVSGIGKKSGQQILIELKFKLDDGRPLPAGVPAAAGRPGGVFHDALAGLKNLGYGEDEAATVLRKILEAEPDLDVAAALRTALKTMAQNKA